MRGSVELVEKGNGGFGVDVGVGVGVRWRELVLSEVVYFSVH